MTSSGDRTAASTTSGSSAEDVFNCSPEDVAKCASTIGQRIEHIVPLLSTCFPALLRLYFWLHRNAAGGRRVPGGTLSSLL